MKLINKLFPLFILLICFSSCRKDSDELINNHTNSPEPIVKIETTFNGIVSDADGNPLEGADVSIDGMTTSTDVNGYFILGTEANVKGAYIKVNLNGYYEAYGNVLPSEGLTYVQFVLIAKDDGSTFNSDQGGIATSGSSVVRFEPNSFKFKNGSTYTGEVTVYADYIDPTSDFFGQQMPGDLTAVNLSNEDVILESFGMLNVEIFGANGEELDISENAILEIAVPNQLLSNAPDQIPMWFFDTEKGYWVEEGSAQLENGVYRTEVSHFTLWNCDVPNDYINIEGLVYYIDAILKHVPVSVTWIAQNQTRTTSTDDQGRFRGKVPPNVELKIEVKDQCGNIVFSETVGPFSSDAFIDCSTTNNTYEIIELSGYVLDCDNNPVSNGYAYIDLGEGYKHYAHTDANGLFETDIVNCNDVTSLTVNGIDLDEALQSLPQYAEIINGEADAGSLVACDIVLENIFQIVTPDTTLVFSPVSVDITQEENGKPVVMDFVFLDKDDNGNKAIYTMTFLDWGLGSMPDQTWFMATEVMEINDLNPTWDFNYNGASVIAVPVNTPTYFELSWTSADAMGTLEGSNGESHEILEFLIRGAK